MSSLNLVRWGSIGFMLAGAVRLVLGFLTTLTTGMSTPTVALILAVIALLIVALLLTSVGLVGLHVLQRESYGFIGRAGFYTVLVAVAARILGSVVLLSGSETLVWLVLVGLWGMAVGFVLYGAATVQARVLPRWYGVLLIVFEPLAIVFGNVGNIWEGVVLLLLGYVLLAPKERIGRATFTRALSFRDRRAGERAPRE